MNDKKMCRSNIEAKRKMLCSFWRANRINSVFLLFFFFVMLLLCVTIHDLMQSALIYIQIHIWDLSVWWYSIIRDESTEYKMVCDCWEHLEIKFFFFLNYDFNFFQLETISRIFYNVTESVINKSILSSEWIHIFTDLQ